MAARAARPSGMPGWPAEALGVALCGILALAGAAALAGFGFRAMAFPAALVGLALAMLYPARAAAVVLFIAVAIEPGAADFTADVSSALYQLPPSIEGLLPLTISPLELMMLVAAASAVFQHRTRPEPLPLAGWAVLAALALGAAYGLHKGAPSNMVYTEARALLMGVGVFVLASRTIPSDPRRWVGLVIAATATLAVLSIARYLFYVRPGTLNVPAEFAFAHESTLMLGAGLVVGMVILLQHTRDVRTALLCIAYCALLVAAMLVTGRRSATLVLIAGCTTTGLLLFPRRRHVVAILGCMAVLVAGAYLVSFWNTEYGAMAQPARAIRSQFDPTSRDESSDTYREIERYNIVKTIESHRLFGVGFGLPFAGFQPLPDLTSFWPLQHYTPHQSVLWLWLKMGVAGIAIVLGFAIVCLQRALAAMRSARHGDPRWALAAVAFAILVSFLAYATVDIAFSSVRAVGLAALAAAVALNLPTSASPREPQP